MVKRNLVQDWMTPEPITVPKDTPIIEARKMMADFRIRRLPVTDGDELVGLLTLGDIRGAEASDATSLSIWELNYLLSKITVEKIMSKPVVTTRAEMSIREAARTMLVNKIAGLPVLSNGRLVGIITESDIFRMLVESWEVFSPEEQMVSPV